MVDAEQLLSEDTATVLENVDGIVVPGGFGARGFEGKIVAVRQAREQNIPFLGICLGMQAAVVEYARHVLRLKDANSTEFNPRTQCPIVDVLDDQKNVSEKGGTMRLGNYECVIEAGTHSAEAYGQTVVHERHRHRYELNPEFIPHLERRAMKIVGRERFRHHAEIVELGDHPWFVAVQFHPEFKSRPQQPHPLFKAFVRAAMDRRS
jgi:CTP synthase